MHAVFGKYTDCTFEIVSGAQLSNLDIVQAAGIYPNVIPGGMWWFNFRTSVYNEMMQYRLEALPATRCTLVATDARSIEWAYCKTLTTKNLLAKFLWRQIEEGNIDRELAMFVAKEWLYGTASRLYT
jgi:glucuronate isomerase